MKTPIYGGIEGGGTKFVCAVGGVDGESLAETRFPTTTPEETFNAQLLFSRTKPACWVLFLVWVSLVLAHGP